MRLGRLVPGRFVGRLNRFAARVEVGGRLVLAHVPNSGRLRELFVPGRRIYLTEAHRPGRKTRYDLACVRVGRTLVSADARLPNRLAAEAIAAGRIHELAGRRIIRPEVRHGNSRFDLLLGGRGRRLLLEVKSATLVEDGVALFPDAPTERGRRHLEKLMAARRRGFDAGVLFVIQRPDAHAFSPHWEADPQFARALCRAAEAGVRVLAYRCRVTTREVALTRAIPVLLSEWMKHSQKRSAISRRPPDP